MSLLRRFVLPLITLLSLVGVGIVGGMALSLYLIWFRYGTHGPDRPT